MQSMEVIVEWHDQHYFIEKKHSKRYYSTSQAYKFWLCSLQFLRNKELIKLRMKDEFLIG